ncbi:MAG: OmpH family outer membrane protein [Balneola sp.]|nr:OmpH family outer membrane protein [Balneola sp.]MBO6651387.1 OmpH family outer membrane protein [Balneola sp.]MBO6710986.1 OmpH family outer membrane protein [Balneola sp.]MBO6801502.1 OmpH family outer membrane protein [Balneola sp.]MBO6870406.1 OmpH family outer membrane protein [Balneola sp.]
MLKKFSIGLGLLFTLLLAVDTNAQSQELKIGFVNPQAVLNRMPEMKAVQQRLKNFADRKSLEIEQKELELQNAVNVYEQKKDVISAAAKTAEEEKLQQMSNDLNEATRTAQQEIQNKRNELLGPLQNQIGAAISAVAEQKGLAYVLNTTTSSGDIIILYASQEYGSKYNITDAVMVELGI